MRKTAVYGAKVARSTSPHCHATVAGDLVFVSGIPGFEEGEARVAAGDFARQMRRSLLNIQDILEQAGTKLDNVLKVNVFLARQSDFAEMNAIYREFFGDDPGRWPARTTMVAGMPREEFLLEIECTAMK